MPKCIELLPCDWLISNLCCQAIEQLYLIKWPVSDTGVHIGSPSWELELRPLGVATGNALSVTRSEDTYEKNTTCWPATAHDVTTGVPQYKCRRAKTSSAFSSSLTGLFKACRVNLVRVQFSNSTMASTSKAFRKCVDPCPRYLTPDDTHDCCVFCLGMEHARDVLEGAVCVHCERLSMRKLSSRLSLFSRKEGQPSASRDSRPTVAEARRRMKSWGSQLVVADKLERDRPLFARRPRTRVSCWIVMMRSFWHHQMQQLVLRCIWTSFLEVMDYKNKFK